MKATTDVLVIGGGVIGCAVAYELRKAEVKVTLLESGKIGQESSAAAAGMLTPQAESDQDDAFFRLCLTARSLYPGYLDELRELTGQIVEWHQDGLLDVPGSREEEVKLRQRYLWQQKAGLNASLLSPEETRQLEPHLYRSYSGASLNFMNEAHLDNSRYTEALAQAALLSGTELRVHEEVRGLLVRGDRVYGVRTGRSDIQAGNVINCAGAWASCFSATPEIQIPVVPVRGQMLALRVERPLVRRLIFSKDCYLVPRNEGELLVGATAEWVGYDKRNTADALAKLLRGAVKLIPELESATFLRAWAGLRPGTPDALPILGNGPSCEGLIHATGHFRNGILLSALTGRLITELVTQNRTSISLKEFTPARFQRGAPWPVSR